MDVKIISNIGYHKGASGTSVLYMGKTASGQYLAATIFSELVGGVATNRWVYYRKSRVEAGYQGGDITLANDVNLALITDAEQPDFVTVMEGVFKTIPVVTGGAALPRLWNLEPAYSLKGEGITDSEIAAIKTGATVPVGTKTDTTTTPGTTTPATGMGALFPSDFSTLFSNPIKFIQDNPAFILIVVGAIYFFRRKQKKPLWLF